MQNSYKNQLEEKVNYVKNLMDLSKIPSFSVFESDEKHYRMRAEFRIWHENNLFYHVMFEPKTKKIIRIDDFPIACENINNMMKILIEKLKLNEILYKKLFQIDYLATLSNKMIISLIYHKKLDENWAFYAKKLLDLLKNYGIEIQLIGRATKQKICFHNDFIDETLKVNKNTFIYRQIENSFTQPNAKINIKMLEWVQKITKNSNNDLLELYCGNANFSIAMAKNFRKILATEISSSSVNAANYNKKINHINNLEIVRLSAEEFTQAMNKIRFFNRLKHINLDDYSFQTVLVDPPRAGLDKKTIELLSQFPKIIYISCNPETLKNNLNELTKTHKISEFAFFDQFPFTKHIESGVFLEKFTLK